MNSCHRRVRRGFSPIARQIGLLCVCCTIALSAFACRSSPTAARDPAVGPAGEGFIVPTRQLIRPAGKSVEFHGRPVDLALSPDGKSLYVKSNSSLLVLDCADWTIRQDLPYDKGGASMHGIVVTPDGKHVWVTLAQSVLVEAVVGTDGTLSWGRRITIPSLGAKKDSYPCGIALLPGGRALVCASINNTLAVIDLSQAKVEKQIEVGVAPYDVVTSADGRTAFVSNWGGRRATGNDKTAASAGTQVVVDERGVASTGTVGVIDLAAGRQVAEIPTGLHPADLLLDGQTLYVANANSDTVSAIDIASRDVRRTIPVRPEQDLPFGSMSNALALGADGKTLYVANGGNNAVAVVRLPGGGDSADAGSLAGFIPAGWYPGAVVADRGRLFIANVKGVGMRDPKDAGKWSSKSYWGSVTKVDLPLAPPTLASMTDQVRKDALVPQVLKAQEIRQRGRGVKPLPVPQHVGDPSVFEHVVYIIKENRTYDQVFGDLPKGNNDPKLCTFGRKVSPNHHALAEQFALLDNYYCNGVLSADGHAWSTEGVAVDYLEKSFGGWSRSYPFPGDDALALSPAGFIWDNVLLHGLSFRNYGEMAMTRREGPERWRQIYQDWKSGSNSIQFRHEIAIDTLRQYSCPDSPGWNLQVPDQIRADAFLREFAEHQKTGNWPNLVMIYLPQDHTLGTRPDSPTPAAMVADNDLALGRIVEAISHSRFWAKTCIFVIEDDPQNGFDHVDGHRSLCLVISSYTKRSAVVSRFYNQTSVLRTMELMLGLPPMNQFDAMSPAMADVFTSRADLTPYKALPNEVPLDEFNPDAASLSGLSRELAEKSQTLPLDKPDQADEDTLNRIIWHSVKGADASYPAGFAGAHGKGLKKLHLKLDAGAVADDDD